MAERGNLLTLSSGTGDKMTRKPLRGSVWAREATTDRELRGCPVGAHLPGPAAAPVASRGTKRPWAAAATRLGRAPRPAPLSALWSTPWLRAAGPRSPNRNRNRNAQAGSHPTSAARTAAREGQDESALHSAKKPQGGAVLNQQQASISSLSCVPQPPRPRHPST